MSDSYVIVASTTLYVASHFFLYWILTKAVNTARSILTSPSDGLSAPGLQVLWHDELTWLAYVGALVQFPMAVGVAMLELGETAEATTRLPLLYAVILFVLSGGTLVLSGVYWRQLRKRLAAARRNSAS